MSTYQTFRFQNYSFDAPSKTLTLQYDYPGGPSFTETFRFDFDFIEYDPAVLDRALQNLFLLAGVSYYKAYLAPQIVIEQAQVSKYTAAFLTHTYQRGLGEFFYVNQLDPRTPIDFPVTSEVVLNLEHYGEGTLIGLGGGKDSLVTVEALRGYNKVATWSVGHRQQLEPLVAAIALPHFWVEREWDRQLLDLNTQGAYNGHVPISAIFAAVGTIVAILSGYRDVVVSNEHSANEPTLEYQGVEINHQYSKSQDFETAYQSLLERHFGDSLRYYSLLRPLSEMRIAEAFAKNGFEKYFGKFSSCNRAFTHDSSELFWCGECPKCAFIFLIMTSFVMQDRLVALFGGRNLLLDPNLEMTYKQLLGTAGDKPLDCVGEIQECRQAMHRAQSRYGELAKFEFELDRTYNYKTLFEHSIPASSLLALTQFLEPLDD